MIETTSTGSRSSQQAASSGSALSNVLGGDSSELFTKLLVAQIKNQDPLQPSDPTQYVSQLTQLSQVESLQRLASQSASSTSTLQQLQVMALGSQVGSQVSVVSDHVALGDQPVQVGFNLENASTNVELVLTSVGGQEKRIPLGKKTAGETQYSIDPSALGLAPGAYGIRVETASKESPSVEVTGRLNSIRVVSGSDTVINVSGVGQTAPTKIAQFNGSRT